MFDPLPCSLPAALTEDPVIGGRFISHYFARTSHHPIDDARVMLDGNVETDHPMDGKDLEKGKPVGMMTLTNRDAWYRLRHGSDLLPAGQGKDACK